MAGGRDGKSKMQEQTRRAQSAAADPRASVWVSANAGTGKTHVLTMRVLRLMLMGTPLSRILCLTYTKAAAAEMAKRALAELARWVMLSPEALAETLRKLTGEAPDPEIMRRARLLFAEAADAPGGLKIQTIHAFCERILRRFPLEAGVSSGFSVLDTATAAALQRQAIDGVLRDAVRSRDTPLGAAVAHVARLAMDAGFDDLLGAALAERRWLDAMVRLGPDEDGAPWTHIDALHRGLLEVSPDATRAGLQADMAAVLDNETLAQLRDSLRSSGKNDSAAGDRAAAVLAAPTPALRIARFRSLFLTQDDTPRTRIMTKGLAGQTLAHASLSDLAETAKDVFSALNREARALATVENTEAVLRIAFRVMQDYTDLKARRAALDFDDLIAKVVLLLNPSSDTNSDAGLNFGPNSGPSEAAQWVLFKLDGGLDHILIDEAQDTSPQQWRIMESLAGDFFAGQGAREEGRTLFAVGDEKQSIYSFQGAAPEMFAGRGRHFAALAEAAGQTWRHVPLEVSFRTVAPVLAAVDDVCRDPARVPGITQGEMDIHHVPWRQGHGGLVELWPPETYEEGDTPDPWSPLDERAVTSPVTRLAARIADTIVRWQATGERLVSEDRPIRPGDILILVRNRRPFAAPMIAALDARGIPVAGADRMRLTDQIAVQDLLALGDFLVLPEDDLALAAILKSPLFDFDDNDLMTLAFDREGNLWDALEVHATHIPRFAEAVERLKMWRVRAAAVPPFEFFAGLLDGCRMRHRMLTRLGPEAADPMDEFLRLALAYDERNPPSLIGFLHAVREGGSDIKRDMDEARDAVRVLTVHGAKGLEAPIVFLPDTCGRASGRVESLVCLKGPGLPLGLSETFVWPAKGAKVVETVADARAIARDAHQEESQRLLYVALTRARDRLYVAGFEQKQGRAAGCWHNIVTESWAEEFTAITDGEGRTIHRREAPQTVPPAIARGHDGARPPTAPPPAWVAAPAPMEPVTRIPLTPSRLLPFDVSAGEPPPASGVSSAHTPADETPSPAMASPLNPRRRMAASSGLSQDARLLRGTLTHALLQHLPDLPIERRKTASEIFLETRDIDPDPKKRLGPRERDRIVRETLAVLNDTAFAPLFGLDSRAEVPISALVPHPLGQERGPEAGKDVSKRPDLAFTGQIDRLVVTDEAILIVDYKTHRPPPQGLSAVPEAYFHQLASYRLALQRIFPARSIRAAILWTHGPSLMEIPQVVLDMSTERLWAFAAMAP